MNLLSLVYYTATNFGHSLYVKNILDKNVEKWNAGKKWEARFNAFFLIVPEIILAFGFALVAISQVPIMIVKTPVSLFAIWKFDENSKLMKLHKKKCGILFFGECVCKTALCAANILYSPILGFMSPIENLIYHNKIGVVKLDLGSKTLELPLPPINPPSNEPKTSELPLPPINPPSNEPKTSELPLPSINPPSNELKTLELPPSLINPSIEKTKDTKIPKKKETALTRLDTFYCSAEVEKSLQDDFIIYFQSEDLDTNYYEHYNISPPKKIVFSGPDQDLLSHTAKVVATKLGYHFSEVKIEDILNRDFFGADKNYENQVIYLSDTRSSEWDQRSLKALTEQIENELQKRADQKIIFVIGTNSSQKKSQRIFPFAKCDFFIEIPAPDEQAREKLFYNTLILKKDSFAGIDCSKFTNSTKGFTYREIALVVEKSVQKFVAKKIRSGHKVKEKIRDKDKILDEKARALPRIGKDQSTGSNDSLKGDINKSPVKDLNNQVDKVQLFCLNKDGEVQRGSDGNPILTEQGAALIKQQLAEKGISTPSEPAPPSELAPPSERALRPKPKKVMDQVQKDNSDLQEIITKEIFTFKSERIEGWFSL